MWEIRLEEKKEANEERFFLTFSGEISRPSWNWRKILISASLFVGSPSWEIKTLIFVLVFPSKQTEPGLSCKNAK